MNPFSSLSEYEQFIYALPTLYPTILRSTLVVIRRGRHYAEVRGELAFKGGYRLVVYERLYWKDGPLVLEKYGYEGWRDNAKLYWYDSQPHPGDITLSNTMPHHKHVPPDIKHHRIPAPGLSLKEPNLPFLIAEIA